MLNQLLLARHYAQLESNLPHSRITRWLQGVLLVFVITLSQTSDNIQTYLSENLASLLGADAVLQHTQPLTAEQLTELSAFAQYVIETQLVETTLTHNGNWQPAQLKAVGQGYPLTGELGIAESLSSDPFSTQAGPQSGTIWLDSRLLASLQISVGDTLVLADMPLRVSHVLLHEPDRLMEGHSVAMRAMVHSDDLSSMQLSAEALSFRYLLSDDELDGDSLRHWQQQHLPSASLLLAEDDHPLALFWQRTENVMGLTSIVLFFMAAIAIQQLAQLKTQREQYFTAVCLSVGVSKASAFSIALYKWCWQQVSLLLPAVMVSALCHWLVIQWMVKLFDDLQWYWQWSVMLQAVFAVSLLFFVFHLPVWMSLKNTSVAQLIRRQMRGSSVLLNVVCALLVLVSVAWVYSDNGLLTAMMMGALLFSIGVILLMAWVLMSLGQASTRGLSGLIPFALYMMKQRIVTKSTQILGVGLCAFLLLFTLMLMRDMGSTMSAYQRVHNGNVMISQATSEQMKSVAQWVSAHQAEVRQQKRFIYAKLTHINGQLLSDYTDKPSDSLATMQKAIRMHDTADVPANNRVDSGTWWQPGDRNWQQISLEQEVITDLGLSLGDTLTFYFEKQAFDFEVVASHVYQSGAGAITFWVQMPPEALNHIDATHFTMGSMEVPDAVMPALGELWQQHPTLRMVSLQALTERFDKTLALVTQLISGFSALLVLLSLLVIVASIHTLEQAEKKKNSIILSFGLSRNACLRLTFIEWTITALIAAFGAIAGTVFSGELMYQSQFSLSYQPNTWILIGTLLVILLCVTAMGVSASKKSLSASIRDLLAE